MVWRSHRDRRHRRKEVRLFEKSCPERTWIGRKKTGASHEGVRPLVFAYEKDCLGRLVPASPLGGLFAALFFFLLALFELLLEVGALFGLDVGAFLALDF
jgi:hypothetical protein